MTLKICLIQLFDLLILLTYLELTAEVYRIHTETPEVSQQPLMTFSPFFFFYLDVGLGNWCEWSCWSFIHFPASLSFFFYSLICRLIHCPVPFLIHSFFLFLVSQYKIVSSKGFKKINQSSLLSFIPIIFHCLYIFNSTKVIVRRINESGYVKIEMYYNISTHLKSFWLMKKYYILCSSASCQFLMDTSCSLSLLHETVK